MSGAAVLLAGCGADNSYERRGPTLKDMVDDAPGRPDHDDYDQLSAYAASSGTSQHAVGTTYQDFARYLEDNKAGAGTVDAAAVAISALKTGKDIHAYGAAFTTLVKGATNAQGWDGYSGNREAQDVDTKSVVGIVERDLDAAEFSRTHIELAEAVRQGHLPELALEVVDRQLDVPRVVKIFRGFEDAELDKNYKGTPVSVGWRPRAEDVARFEQQTIDALREKAPGG